jgi:hypothetical protein
MGISEARATPDALPQAVNHRDHHVGNMALVRRRTADAVGGRRLSARLCAAGLATGSAETRSVF